MVSFCLCEVGRADDSIDFDYVDPRPEERKEEDEDYKIIRNQEKQRKEAIWQEKVDRAQNQGLEAPVRPEEPEDSPVRPDWEQSPVEVSPSRRCCGRADKQLVWWRDDPHLQDFETVIYDLGFKPSGPGF